MRDNMYRAENFLRGPLNEVKEMHLCIFFLFNSVQPLHSWSFHVFHLKSFMDNMPKYWLFNTKSTSKCMLSILHLLKSLYKHIQSLYVFLSLWMKYMKNANDEKINESFGIWKKNSKVCRQSFVELTRFLVRLL